MPRYIYFCENCQSDFTVFHGINDIQVACIECESDKIKKQSWNCSQSRCPHQASKAYEQQGEIQ